MDLLSYAIAIMCLWFLAVHLVRLAPLDGGVLAVIDAILSAVALLAIAFQCHKGGLF